MSRDTSSERRDRTMGESGSRAGRKPVASVALVASLCLLLGACGASHHYGGRLPRFSDEQRSSLERWGVDPLSPYTPRPTVTLAADARHIAVPSTTRLYREPDRDSATIAVRALGGVSRYEVVAELDGWYQVVEAVWCVPWLSVERSVIQHVGFIERGVELTVVAETTVGDGYALPAGTVAASTESGLAYSFSDAHNLWVVPSSDPNAALATSYHPDCPSFRRLVQRPDEVLGYGLLDDFPRRGRQFVRADGSGADVWVYGNREGLAVWAHTRDVRSYLPRPFQQAYYMPCGIRQPFLARANGMPELEVWEPMRWLPAGAAVFDRDGLLRGFLWSSVQLGTAPARVGRLACFDMSEGRNDNRYCVLPSVWNAANARTDDSQSRGRAYWAPWNSNHDSVCC